MQQFKLKLFRALRSVNLAHWICCHILGKHHTHAHRIFVGLVIIFAGVGISHVFEIIHVAFVGSITGRITDAVGCIPVAEMVLKQKEPPENATQ